MEIKIGDKVRTIPSAWQRIAGYVVAIHKDGAGYSTCASVYCGKYESVKVPLCDLQKLSK
jgi:hypothetical protein